MYGLWQITLIFSLIFNIWTYSTIIADISPNNLPFGLFISNSYISILKFSLKTKKTDFLVSKSLIINKKVQYIKNIYVKAPKHIKVRVTVHLSS